MSMWYLSLIVPACPMIVGLVEIWKRKTGFSQKSNIRRLVKNSKIKQRSKRKSYAIAGCDMSKISCSERVTQR